MNSIVPRYIVISALVSVPLGCNHHEGDGQRSGGLPAIRVSPEAIDLGQFRAGKVSSVPTQFKIQNDGLASLRLLEIRPSCACFEPLLTSDTVEPGESATLNVQVRIGTQASNSDAAIDLITNDPVTPRTRLHITWKTVFPVIVQPSELDLGNVPPASIAQATARILVNPFFGSDELEVVSAQSDTPEIESEVVLEDNPEGSTLPHEHNAQFQKQYQLIVRVVAGQEPEIRLSRVRITFKDESLPVVTVPVKWQPTPSFTANPRSLILASVLPGQTVEKKLEVVSSKNKPVRVEAINTSGEELSVEKEAVLGESTNASFTVRFTAPLSLSAYRGQVSFHFRENSNAKLVVPVLALVRSSDGSGNSQ